MLNFEYHTPTKVVFGKAAESKTGSLIKEQGCRKVLVHYGSGSVVRSGLLDRVYASLDAEGIPYVSLGGVVPNPRLSKVREGIALCRREGVDFILAVGGGSVIDSSKAIGYGVANEGDVWDFYARKRTASACLPIGAILTIAAAGSEMSNSSVITNEDGLKKRGYKSEYCRCRFAILNPELTYTLPDYQTQSGCVDILMHTMERYFNQSTNMEMTDGISEALLRTVMKNSLILKRILKIMTPVQKSCGLPASLIMALLDAVPMAGTGLPTSWNMNLAACSTSLTAQALLPYGVPGPAMYARIAWTGLPSLPRMSFSFRTVKTWSRRPFWAFRLWKTILEVLECPPASTNLELPQAKSRFWNSPTNAVLAIPVRSEKYGNLTGSR